MGEYATAPKLTEERIHQIARALADPRRLDLLRRIGKDAGETPCEALRCGCEVTAATLSHHMKELENAGLVESMRDGKFVKYTLRRDVLDAYLSALAQI
jgi:ArsR family transcriptional regulator, arsenate/arsenite/antimonite-responsive transcriptional repressor